MEEKLHSPAIVRALQKKYGLSISKSLGQNFLTDKNIVDKIIEGADIQPEDLVIEIGPGMGVLTRAAAVLAKKVVAIEIDRHLLPVLSDTLKDLPHVEVLHGDVLKTDLSGIIAAQKGCSGVKILGNLPYYITTPIIMKVLEDQVPADRLTIMLQKEVADRLQAKPGKKDYGALSVAVQYHACVHFVTAVPRDVFFPRPNVDSSVICLDIRQKKPVDLVSEVLFFTVIKSGFGQRRKTLQNALQSAFPKDMVVRALEKAEIDPIRRAETLSIYEFANLSNAIAAIQPAM